MNLASNHLHGTDLRHLNLRSHTLTASLQHWEQNLAEMEPLQLDQKWHQEREGSYRSRTNWRCRFHAVVVSIPIIQIQRTTQDGDGKLDFLRRLDDC